MNFNWKLLTVILISLILLIVCYLSFDLRGYFSVKNQEPKEQPDSVQTSKKIKMVIQKEEEFKNIRIPDNHVAYYFYEECPDYKLGYFIVDKEKRTDENEEGLERYHVPEQYHLIIVQKDHIWTKEPNFKYWKSE
jgi:hypothetical protein